MMIFREKRRTRSAYGNLILLIFLVLASVFMVFPLVYTISNSFKPLSELFVFPPQFFVRNPTMQNFLDLANVIANFWVPFSRYFFNTIFITAAGTAGHIFVASHAAYAMANNKFAGSKLIFRIIVLSLMFSPAVTAVPNYLVLSRLGWIDSYWSVIVPVFCSSLGLYLLKQFMEGVPDSLIDSARIDGANEFSVLWKIVMPVVKPAWLTLIILTVQNLWNINSGYIYSEQLKTLAAALNQIVIGGIGRAGTASAAAVIMMIVPITVFVLTQSNVIETMSTSGMKE
jgi:ABC-type glycerol-3-phosphate transport system permease component